MSSLAILNSGTVRRDILKTKGVYGEKDLFAWQRNAGGKPSGPKSTMPWNELLRAWQANQPSTAVPVGRSASATSSSASSR